IKALTEIHDLLKAGSISDAEQLLTKSGLPEYIVDALLKAAQAARRFIELRRNPPADPKARRTAEADMRKIRAMLFALGGVALDGLFAAAMAANGAPICSSCGFLWCACPAADLEFC
ncbi:hypothetical protein, partial [Magnetospirillum sp. LM-5]|uniref:hypothetical protein n=1 Tax=Magnetospirillum sp. LM-5 TaxID=2681466 RepID=UPI0015708ABB